MSDVLEHLYTELDKKVTYLEGEIAKGNLKDFSEYRYLCGQIRGLAVAADLVQDLAKKMDSPEESDDEWRS